MPSLVRIHDTGVTRLPRGNSELGVDSVRLTPSFRQIDLKRLHHQMEVVGHQTGDLSLPDEAALAGRLGSRGSPMIAGDDAIGRLRDRCRSRSYEAIVPDMVRLLRQESTQEMRCLAVAPWN